MMEKQMELFEEGGLKEEGGTVDEESGNDVPTGSTRKEVRDDIPAMLSEGEFIFPADVVRFHGLEKLMELRQQAKMGIKKMEAMGQMGNSDEATLPDDIPFTMDDLIIVAEPMQVEEDKEPKEKANGGLLHANQGTFVSPSTGVIGTQESIYTNQPLMGAPTIPISGQPSNVTQPTTAPVGGYTPLFTNVPTTPTTPTPTTPTAPFVPTVEDAYTTETYVDPNTGATVQINFYQGKPVQAIPSGYIPQSEYDPTTTGTTTTGQTGISTTQVTARDDDDSDRAEIRELKQRADQQRQQKQSKLQSDDPNVLVDMWLENKKTIGAGQSLIALNPLVAGGALAAGLKEQSEIEKLLNDKYKGWREGKGGLSADTAAKLKEFDEAGFFKNTKMFGNALFEDVKEATSQFKDIFSEEGRQKLATNYALETVNSGPRYDVSQNRMSGGASGFKAITKSDGSLKMNQNNMPQSSGNLSLKEQQAYDTAVATGNSDSANHYASIASHRARQDNYAAAVREHGKDSIEAKNAGQNMSIYSKEQAITYGGSVHKAKEEGTASKTTTGFGFFSKYKTDAMKKEEERKEERNDSNDKDSGSFGGYSCYVATALNDKGYWPTIKKMKLIKWCMDTKPEDKFDTKLWRNGYTVFGKTIIAPHVDNKAIQWLSDGFYDATVKNKKDVKSLIGLLFFYVPSYTIALYKMLTNNLVDIERT